MKETLLSQEQILEIQNSVDIVDIVSSYVPLTLKGKNFFGVCPFHPDHSPSMSVSREKQIYKCFSCRASGNVFKFIMDYENIGFIEAVKIVADKAGISLNLDMPKLNKLDQNFVLYDIFNIAQKFYSNNINTAIGQNAREFIMKRHFDSSIIKDFELGLSLNSYDSLTNLLLKKNFQLKDLERTGLIAKGDKGYKDVYINRIMFPLYDLTGKIVGYSGRIYNGEKTSKYFNTKETEIFKKGELLYNYHRAKEPARDQENIIIVEGFFALIRLYTIGVKNVVATLGTAVTKKQALLIKRMAKQVILMFDGDSAGDEATNSCIEELNEIGVIPKIVRLEDNLDPDDYVLKYGKNKMLEKINNPMNVMDYKLSYHRKKKNLNNNLDLSKYVNEILDDLRKIDDDIYKELTLKKLSDESHLSIEFLKKRMDDGKQQLVILDKKIPKKQNKYIQAENSLIYYMLNNRDVIALYNEEKPRFLNQNYRLLARNLVAYMKENKEIKTSNLLTYYSSDKEILDIIQSVIQLDLKDEYTIQEIKDYIHVIKEHDINMDIKRLQDALKTETDRNRKTEILKQIFERRKIECDGDENNDK